MIIRHPTDQLTIELRNGEIILRYKANPVLRSAPIPDIIMSSVENGNLKVETGTSVFIIQPVTAGFDLKFEPAGKISFLLDGLWFGHGEMIHQRLPLNRMMVPLSVLETFDNGPEGQSCKPTPVWYSTAGAIIIAGSPVNVGLNQPPDSYPRYSWHLGADQAPFAYRPFLDPGDEGDGMITLSGTKMHLHVTCKEDLIESYHYLISEFGIPQQLPPKELFVKPTWTTWAIMKTEVSQEKVLHFSEQIIENQYPYGILEIDDRWQSHYGDLFFDPDRFPDPGLMIDILHSRGFKVTSWVIPFFDPKSEAYCYGSQNGYFVKDRSGDPYLVSWWQGQGALLDITNPQALDWFHNNLMALMKKTGLDGFKFDAGEACFIPRDAVFHMPISPNEYTNRYIQYISDNFLITEARSGWLNQSSPIFFRQWDKSSTWGADNGLQSLITGILALGLTGYPFILPDMVGGNAYKETPNAELMIRWTQANALLPAIQFSLPPWEISAECNRICHQYALMHVEYSDLIYRLAEETVKTGNPIIRPIWWYSLNDDTALSCDDEFLLGNNLLVAPVMSAMAESRDIYLPEGKWEDIYSGEVYPGKKFLKGYSADLEKLPVFKRVMRIVSQNSL